ncbi:LLM class flavin-dependent oxidoreductase [Sinomonas atrocyanea]|uniref:LLM class flavin-dependent oxidoreductase n=1 Tax=Sinomonas atrocyanea TaxID=37927 RepID=UPI00277F998F|nr:LLM class flavin-dependent oxidoreductase [Sinomonas atrocyanea]MDQ0260713.1 FMN-dependent oxidoreductase (nitrilotriacetate monooxygenase family) [Sinomonas atrocyanea]MDR6622304.1 FMN-dependent oxidoreductase (nitrilotriacetate monooxygenase family) [Sinomonas atrocyanea]
MTKPLLLNAFEMLVPVHQSPGLWRHPESQAHRFAELGYWTQLAKALEDGGFHGIFFADVLGQYDVYGGSADAAVRGGVQYPALDPLLIVSALAAATERLGFGVTASVTYDHPYLLARRFGTLDHLTGGRLAWNIVTSYQESAARNLGLDTQVPHDERYDRAEEFMDVAYKLWEGSVDDGALVADPAANVFADPAGVRGIAHDGDAYRVPGPALVGPSPQRTPLLFQAGASARGKAFAAKHAEAVFFSSSTPAQAKKFTEGLRAELVAAGRAPDSVRAFNLATVIVAETDEAAAAKLADYESYVDTDAALALFAGWTGVDLSGLDQDAPLTYIRSEANQSALAQFTLLDPERTWTLREVAKFISIGGRGPVIVGSPATVADALERFAVEGGVDGFNLTSAVRPADLLEFARLVTPELRRRGLLAEAAPGATFRETVLGAGPRLAADHPARRVAGVVPATA